MEFPITFPKSVHDTVEAAERRHGSCDAAIPAAVRAVRKLPEFKELVNAFIDHAIRNLLYQKRHEAARAMRKSQGFYGGPAKVRVGESAEVNRAYESVYQYRIGGNVLGELLGKDLGRLAANEDERASGHAFNARLLEWCAAQGVGEEQRVADVIPETKLRKQFERIGRQGPDGRAA